MTRLRQIEQTEKEMTHALWIISGKPIEKKTKPTFIHTNSLLKPFPAFYE